MKKVLLAFLLIILVVGVGFGVKHYLTAPVATDAAVRQLNSGAVRGFVDQDNTYAWLGIPFAKPPVGDLRWRAPQPVAAWQGVRDTLKNGAMCAQVLPFAFIKGIHVLGAEDCLYLDVWTPPLSADELKTAKLPVMVWIHGGANTLGTSSAIRHYKLAGKENVIVVSLQYRLGLLGWLSHPAAREAAATPLDATSNFATLDMVAALQWVQTNIGAFGGNPDNVTLFGQSAGGFNVTSLLVAPQAKGLFHRAIVESGNIQTVPQAMAENYVDDAEPGLPYSSREYINKLLVSDGKAADRSAAKTVQDNLPATELMNYLRGKSLEELFAVVDKRGGLGYSTYSNVRDGIVLPQEPVLELFADKQKYNNVPVMFGSNRDEYKFFLWGEDRFTTMRFGLLPELKNRDDYNHITGYFSDQWQTISVNEPAAILAQTQPGEVFAYRFDWAGQKPILGINMADLFGAAHGIEVTFLFGPDAVDTLSLFAIADDDVEREKLGDAMRGYWASFARTGIPGNGGDAALPVWQPWSDNGYKKLILDKPLPPDSATQSALGRKRGRLEEGGIRMADESFTVAELKRRLRDDTSIVTPKVRCELYSQLFYYAFTTDFWNDAEYIALGCDPYPRASFSPIM